MPLDAIWNFAYFLQEKYEQLLLIPGALNMVWCETPITFFTETEQVRDIEEKMETLTVGKLQENPLEKKFLTNGCKNTSEEYNNKNLRIKKNEEEGKTEKNSKY